MSDVRIRSLGDEARAVLLAESLGSLHEIQQAVGSLQGDLNRLREAIGGLPLEAWSVTLSQHVRQIEAIDIGAAGAVVLQEQLDGFMAKFQAQVRESVALEGRRQRRLQSLVSLGLIFLLGFLSSSVIHLWR